MSRSTQYIGLNDYAMDFLDKLAKSGAKFEHVEICKGMFDEAVYGAKYTYDCRGGFANAQAIYTEELQASPWSSGPMIFTCLRYQLVKRAGQTLDMGRIFCWMLDPSLRGEVDRKSGRYWV